MQKEMKLVGYASGLGGVDINCGSGPLVLQKVPHLASQWQSTIYPIESTSLRLDERIGQMNELLAKEVAQLVRKNQFFCVLGGDHTCAIGTWSGVFDAKHEEGEIGLIWVDAHMDSHTPETSVSGRIHGMPLASLLGYGYPTLTNILRATPKLKPENVCLIAVRSYEAGEAALLERLNVKIYFMDEVKQRGLATIWQEAVDLVSKRTVCYGVSLDLDSIDPSQAPGVDAPEPDGLQAADVIDAVAKCANDSRLIGLEVVEFNPSRDKDKLTENIAITLLNQFGSK